MNNADDLRRDFDGAFALAAHAPEPREAMLGVRVGGEVCMLPLADIQTVMRAGVVTPAPSSRRELVGVAAVRGRIVPVFDLAALLGAAADTSRDWLVIAQGHPVAFAVAAVDGYVAVPRAAIVGTTVTLDGVARPIVPLGRMVEDLTRKEM
jgi:purine-binding chemotaxis protein CheW